MLNLTPELLPSGHSFQLLAESIPQLVWTARPDGQLDYVNRRWHDFIGASAEESSGRGWRLSNEEMKLIVEFTGLGLWWNELPLGKLNWNHHVKEHFWLPPEAEVDIDQFYAILHPDDREPCRQAVERALAGRSLFDIAYRTVNSAGQCKWIHARGRAHYGLDGQLVRFVGITQDITEHKRTENALRDSIERFQLATEAMSGLLYDWDEKSGEVRRSQQGLVELLGYHLDEVPASASWWNERIHPEDANMVKRTSLEVLAAKHTVCSSEYRIRHKDGHYRWVWDRSRLVYSQEGTLVRVVGFTISIDERVRAEQALVVERERLSLAQRAGRVGVFEWDVAGGRIYWTKELNHVL